MQRVAVASEFGLRNLLLSWEMREGLCVFWNLAALISFVTNWSNTDDVGTRSAKALLALTLPNTYHSLSSEDVTENDLFISRNIDVSSLFLQRTLFLLLDWLESPQPATKCYYHHHCSTRWHCNNSRLGSSKCICRVPISLKPTRIVHD